MADIHSVTAEIRRGRKRRRKKQQGKNIKECYYELLFTRSKYSLFQNHHQNSAIIQCRLALNTHTSSRRSLQAK